MKQSSYSPITTQLFYLLFSSCIKIATLLANAHGLSTVFKQAFVKPHI